MKNQGSKKFSALILQNAKGEDHGYFAEILDNRGWGQRIVRLYQGEGIPSGWQEHNLVMVMGGPMNVYEEKSYPYLTEETELIKEAMKRNIPLLGFCLGAQLMAKAGGAEVVKGPKKEIGWYSVHLTEQGMKDPILRSFPKYVNVFQWHGDTFELPETAVRLSGSTDYANQAMRIGSFAYGFQFHFEITVEMIAEWLEDGKTELNSLGDPSLPGKIMIDTENHFASMRALGELFFIKYLEMIQTAIPSIS